MNFILKPIIFLLTFILFLSFSGNLKLTKSGTKNSTSVSQISKIDPINTADTTLLTAKELIWCSQMLFDIKVLAYIKEHIQSTTQKLPLIDTLTHEFYLPDTSIGLALLSSHPTKKAFIRNKKEILREHGYLFSEYSDSSSLNNLKIALIKGNDELDLLRWRMTDGANYGILNKDLVLKLHEWKEKQDFSILEMGHDYVFFVFHEPVKNSETWAKEAYDFCPDIVHQGAKTVERLEQAIKEMNGIYLWWD